VNLQSNDFELFGLAPQFVQDRQSIDARWKELQREAHPDKFVAQGAAAQRLAMQWSARINEAYQRLKDPLKRAAYLCELNTAPVNAENNTAMPTEFLMQQMAWREALDEASGSAELDDLGEQVQCARRDVIQKFEQLLDHEHDYQKAVQQVRALMFIERFDRDVHARLDQIDATEQGQ
jgi:molecular chaperone HscB